jgi:hypothetical protein
MCLRLQLFGGSIDSVPRYQFILEVRVTKSKTAPLRLLFGGRRFPVASSGKQRVQFLWHVSSFSV